MVESEADGGVAAKALGSRHGVGVRDKPCQKSAEGIVESGSGCGQARHAAQDGHYPAFRQASRYPSAVCFLRIESDNVRVYVDNGPAHDEYPLRSVL